MDTRIQRLNSDRRKLSTEMDLEPERSRMQEILEENKALVARTDTVQRERTNANRQLIALENRSHDLRLKQAEAQRARSFATIPRPLEIGSGDEFESGAGIPRPHHMKAYLKKVMDRADASGKRSIMPHLREIRHMHKLIMDTDDYLTALK